MMSCNQVATRKFTGSLRFTARVTRFVAKLGWKAFDDSFPLRRMAGPLCAGPLRKAQKRLSSDNMI